MAPHGVIRLMPFQRRERLISDINIYGVIFLPSNTFTIEILFPDVRIDEWLRSNLILSTPIRIDGKPFLRFERNLDKIIEPFTSDDL